MLVTSPTATCNIIVDHGWLSSQMVPLTVVILGHCIYNEAISIMKIFLTLTIKQTISNSSTWCIWHRVTGPIDISPFVWRAITVQV